MLTTEAVDLLLSAWEERLRRIDETLLSLDAEPAYQMTSGPGGRDRYDGASRQRIAEAHEEFSALFADFERLRRVIEQARAVRASLEGMIWGKGEKLAQIEALLLGPSVPRAVEATPLERRTLLDGARDRASTPEALLNEMIRRFDGARDALLSVWRAWQAVEPAVVRAEQRLHDIEAASSRLGVAAALDGLVALRAEVARVRSQVARDPLGAPHDFEARLAPKFQIVQSSVAGLEARHRRATAAIDAAANELVAIQNLHTSTAALFTPLLGTLELGPAAPLALPSPAEMAALAAAFAALRAPGAWTNHEALARWLAQAASLRARLERCQQRARALSAAAPDVEGRLAARRAQMAHLEKKGLSIPAELLRCADEIEALLRQRPRAVGRAAARLSALERALALALALLTFAGCAAPAPPTEPLLVVKTARAPGLSSPKKTGNSGLTGYVGEVYVLQKSWGNQEWKGTLEGAEARRSSELLQVKRSIRDGFAFLFSEDLERDVPVPSAAWFCAHSPSPLAVAGMPCPEVLVRLRVDPQTYAAYTPCQAESCALGLARGGKLTWASFPRFLYLRNERLGSRPLLVAHHGINRGKISGTSLSLIDAAPGLELLQQLDINIVDASRHPVMRYRTLVPTFAGETLTLEGTEREVDASTNAELSSRPAREVYKLSGNKLQRELRAPAPAGCCCAQRKRPGPAPGRLGLARRHPAAAAAVLRRVSRRTRRSAPGRSARGDPAPSRLPGRAPGRRAGLAPGRRTRRAPGR